MKLLYKFRIARMGFHDRLAEYARLAAQPETPEILEKLAYIEQRKHFETAVSFHFRAVAFPLVNGNSKALARQAVAKLLRLPGVPVIDKVDLFKRAYPDVPMMSVILDSAPRLAQTTKDACLAQCLVAGNEAGARLMVRHGADIDAAAKVCHEQLHQDRAKIDTALNTMLKQQKKVSGVINSICASLRQGSV